MSGGKAPGLEAKRS